MMADVVLECTDVVRLAKADFAYGKPKMIPGICGRLCSRGRTRDHQDAHKLNRNRITTEASINIATGAVAYHSLGNHPPGIVPVHVQMLRAVARAILTPN